MGEIRNPGFEAENWTEDADGDPVFFPPVEPTYSFVLGELDEQIKGIAEEEGTYGTSREENFQTFAIALRLAVQAHPNGVARVCAAALIALYDERGSHAMTEANFNAFADEWRADRLELEAQLREARAERDELLTVLREANDNRLLLVDQHRQLIDALNDANARLESIRQDGIEALEREP